MICGWQSVLLQTSSGAMNGGSDNVPQRRRCASSSYRFAQLCMDNPCGKPYQRPCPRFCNLKCNTIGGPSWSICHVRKKCYQIGQFLVCFVAFGKVISRWGGGGGRRRGWSGDEEVARGARAACNPSHTPGRETLPNTTTPKPPSETVTPSQPKCNHTHPLHPSSL